jgi:hypothetical protein
MLKDQFIIIDSAMEESIAIDELQNLNVPSLDEETKEKYIKNTTLIFTNVLKIIMLLFSMIILYFYVKGVVK